MKSFNIHWQYCLPIWLNHTFPSSVKRGVERVSAKNIAEAKSKFREMGYHDVTEGQKGYFRINHIEE